MKTKTITIDFEGSLFDTETVLFESWKRVYDIFGITLNLDYWITSIRPDRPHAAAYYALRYYVNDPPSAEVAQSLQKRFENELMLDISLRSGIKELLSFCKNCQIKTVVVSSLKSAMVSSHINRLNIKHLIDTVITTESLSNVISSDQSYYSHVTGLLNCLPEEVLVVESSPWGIRSANGAAIPVIGFPNDVTQMMDFSMADILVKDGKEIIDLLTSREEFSETYSVQQASS
jgi:mannitol-1-/sugar-/sorbitol-6-/2-deoxyglucose-6-phosphatase